MSKNIKEMLAQRLAENSQRHSSADQVPEFDAGRQHTKIPVDAIDPNPFQPRTVFPVEELEALASSISESGLLQPINVRKSGERYQLIAGERRLRACKLLGRSSIEALVSDCDDGNMAVMALAENIDREDLSDYEIGKALRQVETLFPTKKKLAESLGLNREDMYRYFAFEALPDFVRARLDDNPRLLSRAAAADLRRVLQQQEGKPETLARLQEAWALLEACELDQTKLAPYLSKTLREGIARTQDPAQHWSLNKDGKEVCTLSKNPKSLTLKLDRGVFGVQQEDKIRQFLESLLESAVDLGL